MLWMWGLLGAFIYAGPRLVRCMVTCRETGAPRVECFIAFAMALCVGAAAGHIFAPVLLTYLGWKDQNAVSALIGVFVNPAAPEFTKRIGKVFDAVLGGVKAAKGDDE